MSVCIEAEVKTSWQIWRAWYREWWTQHINVVWITAHTVCLPQFATAVQRYRIEGGNQCDNCLFLWTITIPLLWACCSHQSLSDKNTYYFSHPVCKSPVLHVGEDLSSYTSPLLVSKISPFFCDKATSQHTHTRAGINMIKYDITAMSSTVNLLTMKVLHKYRSANVFVLYRKYNNINTRTMNISNKMLWTTDLSHIIITQLHRASPFHLQEAQILMSSPGCGGSWGSLSHACLILWQDKGADGGWLIKTINHHLNWPIAVAHWSNINLVFYRAKYLEKSGHN